MRGRILVVEDEPNLREVLCFLLKREGFVVDSGGDLPAAEIAMQANTPDVILTDLKLPSGTGLDVLASAARYLVPVPPVVILTAFGSIDSAVEAVKRGAYDYLTKPYNDDHLLLALDRAIRQRRLQEENSHLRSEVHGTWNLGQFVTRSPRLQQVLAMASEVSRNPSTTILIQGESGTGKEVLARAIHNESERRHGRFVAIHCGAIPDTLLESELFGYEKGAFTGALHTKQGKLELAHDGTVFLDEIGDMPPSLQVKLLRVLQERVIERLGGLNPIEVDVRVIAATHRDLTALVRENQFRADLYYRLNVFPLTLPPLRDRREDVADLAYGFLHHHATAMGRTIRSLSPEALRLLETHTWPGNVRELQNAIERAVILCRSDRIEPQHLPFDSQSADSHAPLPIAETPTMNLVDSERALILQAMQLASSNQSEAAKLLGISRWQLRTKLEKYGIGK